MKCQFCGGLLPADSQFCKHCGATVPQSVWGVPVENRRGGLFSRPGSDSGYGPSKSTTGQTTTSADRRAEAKNLDEEIRLLEELLSRTHESTEREEIKKKIHLKRVRRSRHGVRSLFNRRNLSDMRRNVLLLGGAILLALVIAFLLLRYLDRQNQPGEDQGQMHKDFQAWVVRPQITGRENSTAPLKHKS
ncbi:MAG: zinc ribbon domain-containing protein [Acidobacteriia bacterium]|nr:zinc ribbon domain-containing protein [Terriglobia bacterium]